MVAISEGQKGLQGDWGTTLGLKQGFRPRKGIQEMMTCLSQSLTLLLDLGPVSPPHNRTRWTGQIFIQSDPNQRAKWTATGQKTHILQILPDTTIHDLKQRLSILKGIPPNDQRLLFAGRESTDPFTLSQLAIPTESTLILSLRLRGGEQAK